MRSDMHKVIVERPRLGSRMPNISSALKVSPKDLDESGDFDDEGAPKRPVNRKMLNEHLRPLERYLMKQIGRPWDKVYAEIRKGIDTRSAIGLHVLQHVPDYVFVDTRLENGKVVGASGYGTYRPVWGMYVHPRTGLLRYAKRRRLRQGWRERRTDEVDDNFVPIDTDSAYEKLRGVWFHIVYGEAPARDTPRPIILKRQLDRKTIGRLEAGEFGSVTNKLYCSRVNRA